MTKEYVLSFLFNEDATELLLIKKRRPFWQANHYNGIGGKTEEFDKSYLDAAIREIKEETGLKYSEDELEYKLEMFNEDYSTEIESNKEFSVRVFTSFNDKINKFKSLTDEEVFKFKLEDIPKEKLVNSVTWLLPLILYEDPEVQIRK